MIHFISSHWFIILTTICGIISISWIVKGFINAHKNPYPETFRDVRLNRAADRIMEREFRKREHKDYNNEDVDQNFLNGLPAEKTDNSDEIRAILMAGAIIILPIVIPVLIMFILYITK